MFLERESPSAGGTDGLTKSVSAANLDSFQNIEAATKKQAASKKLGLPLRREAALQRSSLRLVWERRFASGKKVDIHKLVLSMSHVLAIAPEGPYRLGGKTFKTWPGLTWESLTEELQKFNVSSPIVSKCFDQVERSVPRMARSPAPASES